MERYYNILFLFLTIGFFASCEDEIIPNPNSTDPLFRVWSLDIITINGQTYGQSTAQYEMIAGNVINQANNNKRKLFQYKSNGIYAIDWQISSDYELGTEGSTNWQPGIGYYYLSQNGDSIYHNSGMAYEAKYSFEIDNSGHLLRYSERYMSEPSPTTQNGDPPVGQYWQAGDKVSLTEEFIPFEQ